ncbi:MAG: hypothetical protein R3C97_10870 [Geminicoccaceae bacterium]
MARPGLHGEQEGQRIKGLTFFTTMVDFTDPGELGVFIDEEQLAGIEEMMTKRGYLDGSEMAPPSTCCAPTT